MSLNAPYGARCFLTVIRGIVGQAVRGLNAPYGARCFLTGYWYAMIGLTVVVLMHLMVRGAF